MDSLEPKKLALIRILQILQKHTDAKHRLTQEEIIDRLDKDYGITVERKAISRNLSLLKEAGFEIDSNRSGSCLECRDFEDAELKLLIDSVLCSQHINPRQSADLIEKLCSLSNKYFRSHVKNVHTVNEWNKTENSALFYNIEMVDTAIREEKQLQYDYNKYGLDKKLHKSSFQRVTPYQLILHNQKYYLMAYSSYWGNMVYHRLDRISNIAVYDQPAQPLRELPGYGSGINYKKFSTAMPYMYTDEPERITFLADSFIIDQVIDWFGKDIILQKAEDPNKVSVALWASPNAMEHWALQYLNYVEIIGPDHLRQRIREDLKKATEKYE